MTTDVKNDEILTLGQNEGFDVAYEGGIFWLQEADEGLRTIRRCMSAAGAQGQHLNARKRNGVWQLAVRQGDVVLDAEYNSQGNRIHAIAYRIVGIDAGMAAGGLNGIATLRVVVKASLIGPLTGTAWTWADERLTELVQHVIGNIMSTEPPRPDLLTYGKK